MTRKYPYYVLAAALLVAGLTYVLFRGEVITLRADDSVQVRRSPVQPSIGANVIHTLAAGERADVVECEDIKTDLVIRVRVGSGETGYVGAGRYSLERQPATLSLLLSTPARITFSCRGMFEHRTRGQPA